jgi:DNA-binding HxlR family transcriptional regulator
MFESCIGCKWTLHVLGQIRRGVRRPGALERSAPGLTAKVLGERLNKLQRFGIVERKSFPEIPPRVEYSLTPFGQKFVKVIDQIEALKCEIENDAN